jgi:sialidase-1
MFLGGTAGVTALGLTGAGLPASRQARAIEPGAVESKMLFGDAHAGAAAVPKPSGDGFYHSVRIPAIYAIPGTSVVVAVAEGRPNGNRDDSGNRNLLLRRSTDSGRSWGPVVEFAGATLYSWTNPTMVHDRTTGHLYCFMLRRKPLLDYEDDPKVYLATSDDNGATWTGPVVRNDLNRRVDNGPTDDFIGPGNGIQRADGSLVIPARGRLIIKEPGGDWAGHHLPSGLSGGPYGEGTVAERSDGQLILNYRATDAEHRDGYAAARRIAIGNPGDWRRFGTEHWRAQIIDPGCHGAQITHTVGGSRLLVHLNSASTAHRYALAVRTSADNGESWTTGKKLTDFPLASEGTAAGDLREGGYSALTSTGSGIVLALTEARRVQRNGAPVRELDFSPCAVVLRRFDAGWLPRAPVS